MLNVNNKKTIRKVADITFKADKMRNLFAIIAIILTTVLFSGLFTISGSLLTCLEQSTMRQVGTSSHGGFKYLSIEEYEQLKEHPIVKEMSYSVVLGIAENDELKKRPTEIRYANDELVAKMMFSLPTTGRMPEAENEAAMDTLVLERLGIPAKLGEEIVLSYSLGGEKREDTFTLVGFWEGDIISNASQIWLSKTYVENALNNVELSSEEEVIGTLNAEVNFKNSWNVEKNLQRVITESGYSLDEIDYGINWAYTSEGISAEIILGIGAVIAVIVFCGYLMISNVFLISVTKDVQFYGLLKTIGTTGKQIKAIIRRQAAKICLIGIPLGVLLGCVVGAIVTPFVLSILNTNVIQVSIRWWGIVGAAFFAMITVGISIQRALKIASKVSPIEALRTTEVTVTRKKKTKTGSKIKIWKMAKENVGRNRKRVVMVTISLSLSLIILNCAYSMANSFDMDKYLANMIRNDFVVGDVSCFNVYLNYLNQPTLDEAFKEELLSQEGIEVLEEIYFTERGCQLDKYWENMATRASEELGMSGDWLAYLEEEIASGTAIYHVYGVSDTVWEDFTVYQGEIDLEKLYSGDYVVVNPFDNEGRLSAYEIGDKVEVFTTTGESKTCEVLAIASIPYEISVQHVHPVDINFFLPADVFLETVEKKEPMFITLDVADAAEDDMETFLTDYCEKVDPNMQYASKAVYMEEYKTTQNTYRLVGTVISVLLALIGIANFANTNITAIMTRKRELAVLESIGMTVKQQKKMLITEGCIYMLLALGVASTLGVLMGNAMLKMLLSGEYYTVTFTVMPTLVCVPILFLLAVVIPLLSRKYVNRESVIERIS